ncbi:hypothetical protein DID74_01070 [Candidatus Marinamargulisbacteria bacterium SCGC AG-333-B06]|nr:hypothetical protein DID74_01070 [Candidatus Marinamargulisbacteria bacterium SCGC AG-333-B06]
MVTNVVYSKGFTLMEMLIVVTIIGILSSIIIPKLHTNINQSKQANYLAEVARINTQIELFNFLNGYYPISMDNENWSNTETGCKCQYTYFFPEGVPTSNIYGNPWVYDNILGRVSY